jgi:hypothetical protein
VFVRQKAKQTARRAKPPSKLACLCGKKKRSRPRADHRPSASNFFSVQNTLCHVIRPDLQHASFSRVPLQNAMGLNDDERLARVRELQAKKVAEAAEREEVKRRIAEDAVRLLPRRAAKQ